MVAVAATMVVQTSNRRARESIRLATNAQQSAIPGTATSR